MLKRSSPPKSRGHHTKDHGFSGGPLLAAAASGSGSGTARLDWDLPPRHSIKKIHQGRLY